MTTTNHHANSGNAVAATAAIAVVNGEETNSSTAQTTSVQVKANGAMVFRKSAVGALSNNNV